MVAKSAHKHARAASLNPLWTWGMGLLVGIVVWLVLSALRASPVVRFGMAWDVATLAVLVHPTWIILHSTAEQTKRRAAKDDPGVVGLEFIKVGAGVTGLVASVVLISHSHDRLAPANDGGMLAVLGIIAIVTAWLFLHIAYSFRYAHIYYRSTQDVGGLNFPGEAPNDVDFAYFAFTVGMTFQTSDVTVTNRAMRRVVLGHALLSFTFNTAILALAINLIAGLL